MKTKKRSLFCSTTALLLSALSLFVSFEVLGQQPPISKKEQAAAGYLGKSSPPGLRFAPPPKPPVAYLPPLPITYDPQPVFTPEFASPLGVLPQSSSTNTASIQAPTPHVPGPEIVSPIYNSTTTGGHKQGQIPVAAGEVGVVSPQMLVKFFQMSQPGEVQMLMNNPVSFSAPLKEERRSSSATYEKK